MSELARQLAKARSRPGFMERLQTRIAEDKSILDRLALMDEPCPVTGTIILGLETPSIIPCGQLKGHKGPHSFYAEWIT